MKLWTTFTAVMIMTVLEQQVTSLSSLIPVYIKNCHTVWHKCFPNIYCSPVCNPPQPHLAVKITVIYYIPPLQWPIPTSS